MSLIQVEFGEGDSDLESKKPKQTIFLNRYLKREEVEIQPQMEIPVQLSSFQDQSHLLRRSMRRISSDGR